MERPEACEEAIVFLDHFKSLADPRQRGKVVYALDEVLLLCLLAVLAGAESIVDIARFGEKKLALLRRFRPFADGTPSHDQLGTVLATLDAAAFQQCFVAWVAAVTGQPAEVIAIDGKTSRRTVAKKGGKAPLHMVSAFAARQRLVLGQLAVGEKSNEIVAIPSSARHAGHRGRHRHHRRHGVPARDRSEDRRQEGRLRPRPQSQPAQPARRCRAVRGGAKSQWLQGHGNQPPTDGGWRPWPHRDPDDDRDRGRRLARRRATPGPGSKPSSSSTAPARSAPRPSTKPGFCNGRWLVNPFLRFACRRGLALSGVGARCNAMGPPPDGVR